MSFYDDVKCSTCIWAQGGGVCLPLFFGQAYAGRAHLYEGYDLNVGAHREQSLPDTCSESDN